MPIWERGKVQERSRGGGRFGYITWCISQPGSMELLNWSKNFTQNNHKIWAILQCSAPLLFKPRRERSQEDSNGEFASWGGSVGPPTRRASQPARCETTSSWQSLWALLPALGTRRGLSSAACPAPAFPERSVWIQAAEKLPCCLVV